jgi:L-ribulose-5-phosphate 3-epimerase
MKYALMESFQMHHSDTQYGVVCSNRIELFRKAKELGFDGIEFGLNRDYAQDPLWTGEGVLREAMREASAETGVEARSLCLHLFNYREFSPASEDPAHRRTARQILEQAMAACHAIGASVILVPFFGTATLETRERIEHLAHEMRSCASTAESLGICLGLETSLDASATLAILAQIESNAVQVYFDTGNAAGLNYEVVQEIQDLQGQIAQAHVKDHPTTPVLGSGGIDFQRVIQALCQIGFQDYLVLELPTSDDATMQANLSYLKRLVETERACEGARADADH